MKRWLGLRNGRCAWLFHSRTSTSKLSSDTPRARLKKRLQRIGIDPAPYGSHSGRRTLATTAAKKGIQERLIKKHCNWKSDVVYQYIEESVENRLSVSAALLSG
jgi:integrase